MPNPKKQEILKQLKKDFQKAEAVFFIDYQGLNVSQMNQLRRSLDTLNAKIQVAKNTLIHLADSRIKVKLPTGVVFAYENGLKVLKLLALSAKEFENSFNIKLGLLENKLYKPAELLQISQLPTKEVLLSKLIATLKTPLVKTHFYLEYKLKILLLNLKILSSKKEV